MNRPCGSDSLAALMSIRPATEDHGTRKNRVFERRFQSPFDEDDCAEESGHVSEKKRRLGSDQVKALEKNFELDNKLEPERKVELARELGLQPRQVAVWFQNRRARWKTKQLERDYDALKSSYDALKLKFDSLRRENEDLLEEIEEAKAKLFEEENTESNLSAKEETTMAYSIGIDKASPPSDNPFPVESESEEFLCQSFINNNGGESGNEMSLFTAHSKDGSSEESDSSAVLNSPKEAAISSPPAPCNYPKLASPSSLKTKGSSSSGSSLNRFQIQKSCQPQQDVKMEEQNLFGGEEGCSFFSADQAPTLQWCYEDHQWD